MNNETLKLLNKIGWHSGYLNKSATNRTTAVREFQRGFGFGLLVADGDPGPLTMNAMIYSANNDGRCTPNFKFSEFKSRYGIISLHSSLPRGLEMLRAINGTGINIINGYRDPRHNREVGGASKSVHLSGAAADATLPHISKVLALGVFSGVGATLADGITRHVDMRNADQYSLRNGGSPKNPALWGYKSSGGTTNAPAKWKQYPTNGPGLPPLLTWKVDGGKKSVLERPIEAPAWTKKQREDFKEKVAPKPQPTSRPTRSAAANDALIHQVRKAELMLNEVKKELGI